MSDYEICDEPGPCWDGYVYVGPVPRTKGSCIKKENKRFRKEQRERIKSIVSLKHIESNENLQGLEMMNIDTKNQGEKKSNIK